MEDDRQAKADEMVHLYEALAAAVGEEIADRLFPGAWRHLRRIRARERERRYVEHKAHDTKTRPIRRLSQRDSGRPRNRTTP